MTTGPEFSEEYYEHLARTLGDEQAAWARLPPAEREHELRWYHAHFDTPDDLADWPPELDGGRRNGFYSTDSPRLQSTARDPKSEISTSKS